MTGNRFYYDILAKLLYRRYVTADCVSHVTLKFFIKKDKDYLSFLLSTTSTINW